MIGLIYFSNNINVYFITILIQNNYDVLACCKQTEAVSSLRSEWQGKPGRFFASFRMTILFSSFHSEWQREWQERGIVNLSYHFYYFGRSHICITKCYSSYYISSNSCKSIFSYCIIANNSRYSNIATFHNALYQRHFA